MIDFTSIQQMLEDSGSSGLPLWKNIMISDCQRQGIGADGAPAAGHGPGR